MPHTREKPFATVPRRGSRPGEWLALLLVAAWGCGTGATERPQATAPDQAPSAPPDRSLTRDEYMKAGAPAPDKPWSAAEMAAAAKALSAILEKNPDGLPRYQSERSGDLFARVISDENLAP